MTFYSPAGLPLLTSLDRSDFVLVGDSSNVNSLGKATVATLAAAANGFDVRSYGATGNGTTDDTAAVVATLTAALAAGGGYVYFPDGRYRFALASQAINPGAGNVAFVGQSMDNTVLKFDEGSAVLNSGSEKYLFNNSAGTYGTVEFRNFKIEGTFTDSGGNTGKRGGNAMRLRGYSGVTLRNVWFDGLTQMAAEFLDCGALYAIGCRFTNIASDGLRARDTPDIIVNGCTFYRTGDNPVAFHTNTAGSAPTSEIRERIIVTGNHFLMCTELAFLGARKIDISHNVLNVVRNTPITIIPVTPEGENAIFDIRVCDNIITNSINIDVNGTVSPASAVIGITTPAARGATVTNSTTPTRWNSTASAFVKPWDWYQGFSSASSYPVAPADGIVISGNIIARTYPATATISSWGHGTFNAFGKSYDANISEANMRPGDGIRLNGGYFWNTRVSDNVIEHVGNAINFAAPANSMSYRNVKVTGNTIHDARTRGIFINSASTVYSVDMEIDDNTIDCDPYRENTNSAANGTYSADGTPRGVDLTDSAGVTVRRNSFKNCCATIVGNYTARCVVDDNVGFCGTPAATGFNTGNRGIGNIAVSGIRYVIIDANPSSATYGDVSDAMATDATAQPASGWYYQGWFVRNRTPALATGKVTLGWTRLTTGTGHVANTDWAAAVCPNS